MYENKLIDKAQYEEELDSRWSWITEDISDKEIRLNTQLVLENSYKKMVAEGAVSRGWLQNNILNEEVITEAPQISAAVGDYVIPKVMFPIIRRVMPELIANKLVSVQPLTQPTGVIYWLNYRYSDTKGGVTAQDEFSANPQQTTPAYSTYYSSEKFPFAGKVADATTPVVITDAAQVFAFLGNDATAAEAYKRVEILDTTSKKAIIAKKVTADTTTVTFSSDSGTGYAELTKDSLTITADALSALGAAADDELVVFVVYNQEGTSHIPEMEFNIDHMDVSTTERKLKVRWTKEAEQDMQAYHKIDVEQELVKMASVQTNYEIDREVIKAIDDIVISDLMSSFDWTADDKNGTSGNYLDRHRALAQKLYQMCTKVAQYNHLAPADWAVVNPQVAACLQMLPDWKAGEIAGNKSTFYNAGALGNGTVQIYVDPNRLSGSTETITTDEVTLGFKSKDSTYGAGIVYSPYANWMSSTVVDPDNFNNIRGTFSRYAITATPRAQYNYARFTITNLSI